MIDWMRVFMERKASELEAKIAVNPDLAHESSGLPVPNPKIIPAALAIDVVEDQVVAVLDHYRDSLAGDSRCGCEMCGRYDRIRVIAMEPFAVRAMGVGA